jgi:hypothetical protein
MGEQILHDLGNGSHMLGYTDFDEGMRICIKQGNVVMMPSLKNCPDKPDNALQVKCPMCGTDCWRFNKIPVEARVACTACAFKQARSK